MALERFNTFLADVASDILYSNRADQAEEKFTKYIAELDVKDFLAISDILYYNETHPNNVIEIQNITRRTLKNKSLSSVLINIITKFLAMNATYIICRLGTKFITRLYTPHNVILETKNVELIKILLDKSGSDIDPSAIEEWLDDNKGNPDILKKWQLLDEWLKNIFLSKI